LTPKNQPTIMSLHTTPKDQLLQLADRIEQALASKASKAAIVRTIAEHGYCSPKSTGIEKTLIKVLTSNGIPIKPKLAAVMGVSPTPSTRTETPDVTVAPTLPTPEPEPQGQLLLPMTGGVSHLVVDGNKVKTFFADGRPPSERGCDGESLERNLRSNYILLELTESSP